MTTTTVVIPCFNEEKRLDTEQLRQLVVEHPAIRLLLVDDGSSDRTRDLLARLSASMPDRIAVLSLERNSGKAEAVRRGLLRAIEDARPSDSHSAAVIGYADADLATPVDEIARLARLLHESADEVIIGSRVRLLGREIERRPVRHYLGRIFATFASLVLRVPVYDTQCGAKFFRATPLLGAALAQPFASRWIFDVELLARLLDGTGQLPGINESRIREEPLLVWRDVPGSKVGLPQMVLAALDLLRIWRGRV